MHFRVPALTFVCCFVTLHSDSASFVTFLTCKSIVAKFHFMQVPNLVVSLVKQNQAPVQGCASKFAFTSSEAGLRSISATEVLHMERLPFPKRRCLLSPCLIPVISVKSTCNTLKFNGFSRIRQNTKQLQLCGMRLEQQAIPDSASCRPSPPAHLCVSSLVQHSWKVE